MRFGADIGAELVAAAKHAGLMLLAMAFDELRQSRLHVLLGEVVLWGVLGLALGFVAGLVACIVVRLRGGYTLGWRHAAWVRVPAMILSVVGCAAALGLVGAWEGGLRGGEVVLRESQLATRVFPLAGNAGADLILLLDESSRAGSPASIDSAALTAALEAFRADRREADVVGLFERAGGVTDRLAEELLLRVTTSVPGIDDFPGGRAVVEASLGALLRGLLSRKLAEQAAGLRLDTFLREVVEALPEVAACAGDPRTATRAELSDHIIQRGLVPALLRPLRGAVRSQQLLAALAWLGCVLLPPGLFALAEWMRRRRAAAAPGTPGPPG